MKNLKQLQNNFTTPEQSKRLLELGVPKDSADCYFYDWDLNDGNIHSKGGAPQIFDWFERCIKNFKARRCVKMYPCWSVGRLIEIHDICIEDRNTEFGWAMAGDYNYIDYIISRFEDEIMNFSKLED